MRWLRAMVLTMRISSAQRDLAYYAREAKRARDAIDWKYFSDRRDQMRRDIGLMEVELLILNNLKGATS